MLPDRIIQMSTGRHETVSSIGVFEMPIFSFYRSSPHRRRGNGRNAILSSGLENLENREYLSGVAIYPQPAEVSAGSVAPSHVLSSTEDTITKGAKFKLRMSVSNSHPSNSVSVVIENEFTYKEYIIPPNSFKTINLKMFKVIHSINPNYNTRFTISLSHGSIYFPGWEPKNFGVDEHDWEFSEIIFFNPNEKQIDFAYLYDGGTAFSINPRHK